MAMEPSTPEVDRTATTDASTSDGFRGRIARGFAWEGLSKLAVQVFSWVSTVWVARLLSPDDYGLVATSGLFTGAMSILMDFGLGAGVVTSKTVNERQLTQCFWLNVSMGMALWALLFVMAPFIASAYQLPQLTNILRVAGLGLPIGAWRNIPLGVQLRALNYRYRALVEMSGQFVQGALVITLALGGFGAWSLVIGYLCGQLFTTVAFSVRGPKIGAPVFSTAGIEGILRFGVRITGARALGFAVSSSDMMMITSLLGARAAGVYTVSFNLASAPLDKIGAIFNRVAYPAIARMNDDAEKARRFLIDLHFALLAVASPALVGAALAAPDLIAVLLTAKWSVAVPVLQVICIANIVRLSGMLMPVILEARGRAGLVLRFQIVSALLMPLGFFVGSHCGLIGMTYVWLVVYPIIYAWLLRLVLRELAMRIRDLLRSVLPVLLSNVAMALAVLAVRQFAVNYDHLARLGITIGTGVATYAACMALVVPRSFWNEIRSAAASLRK
jgi:O-antigen/teichoic acid export membrane protein